MNKLKEFILNNKVYSKCSEQEQKEILDELERAEQLENALDKACEELEFLGNNLLGKEQWKEWCLSDE